MPVGANIVVTMLRRVKWLGLGRMGHPYLSNRTGKASRVARPVELVSLITYMCAHLFESTKQLNMSDSEQPSIARRDSSSFCPLDTAAIMRSAFGCDEFSFVRGGIVFWAKAPPFT